MYKRHIQVANTCLLRVKNVVVANNLKLRYIGSCTGHNVGIIGSGLIGRSWAMLFAGAGFNVHLFDVNSKKVPKALRDIEHQLKNLESKGLLRGTISASKQFSLIQSCTSMSDAMKNAVHVQECVLEDLELKRRVFEEMDRYADDRVVLSSSTSAFPASQFTEHLKHRSQCIVSHPVNPPYYIPLVELIPAPWTDSAVVKNTRALMEKIGQKPVTLQKELPGFVLNRLQAAILNECWNLIEDGVMDVQDVDTVMSEGLGMRYAFLGPLETVHLNAEGSIEYYQKYGETLQRISRSFKGIPDYGPKIASLINDQLSKKMPLPEVQKWRQWRDERLAKLSKLKQSA